MDIMTDDSTAEKAWEEWATETGSLNWSCDKRAFMAGRASRDAEVAELQGLERTLRAELGDVTRMVESLREQLAEAQATIERLNEWIETLHPAQREAWKSFLSAPSSTGGN